MKYTRLIALLAASTMLATFSANAYDKDGAVYDKDGDGKHHKKHHHKPFHRYTITGGATYLAPTLNGLDYVNVETTTAAGETLAPSNINPNYNWGYYLAFDYMISRHYDVQASWQQFNSNQSDSTSVLGGADTHMLTSSLDDIIVADGVTDIAETTETLNTQSFDANVGQFHKVGRMLTVRPFAGVRYSQINSKTVDEYTGTSVDLPITEEYNSKYWGVGPEIGFDGEYKIAKHFGLFGRFAASFLVGDLTTETDYTEADGTFVDFDGQKDNRITPELDAKLGLNWNSLYAQETFGIGIEGGYQVSYFFDVVDQVQITDAGPEHQYSDVGIMGPYVNLFARF